MKRIIIFSSFIIALTNYSKAQGIYDIALWYQYKECAITYTFDDNTPKQLTVALPIFDSLGFKATFYPVINWNPDWNKLKTAALNGHEVACHTLSHPFLNKIDSIEEEKEYMLSISTINKQIGTDDCKTIAYPYCITGRKNIIEKYFIGGRICNGQIVLSTPSDFYNISSILIGSETSINKAEDLNNLVNQAKASKGWCIFLLHGIDNDGGYSSINSSELRKHLIYVKNNNDKFWVTSFANAIKYIKERNSIKIEEISNNNDTISIKVTDSLDDNIYNVPVTIRRILPEDWSNAKVIINNITANYSIKTINNKKFIIFDVIPDSQDIKIIKQNETVSNIIDKHSTFEIKKVSNKLEISCNSEYLCFLTDISGKIIFKKINRGHSTIDLLSFNPGLYILKIASEKDGLVFTQKVYII